MCPGASLESACGDLGSPMGSLGKRLLAMCSTQCYIVSHDAVIIFLPKADDNDDDEEYMQILFWKEIDSDKRSQNRVKVQRRHVLSID